MLEAPQRSPSRAPWVALLVVSALGGAGLVFYWFRHRAAPPPAAPAPAAPAAVAPAPPPAAAPGPAVGPERLRALLEAVSGNAMLRRWLAEGDVVRRWAVIIDNLAQGTSPTKPLAGLAPRRDFAVVERGDRTFIAPSSHWRYDAFADAVATVDAQAAARAYRELHGPLEAAYRGLGYPEGSIDRAAARALQRIAGAPVRDGDVEVVSKGAVYLYADPRLEELGEVEKQLLRMGPRNTKLLQAKAREMAQALGFPIAGG